MWPWQSSELTRLCICKTSCAKYFFGLVFRNTRRVGGEEKGRGEEKKKKRINMEIKCKNFLHSQLASRREFLPLFSALPPLSKTTASH